MSAPSKAISDLHDGQTADGGRFNAVNRGVYISDNLQFLHGLNSETIDLVIIDPPFGKSQTFSGIISPPLTKNERLVETSLLASWGITDIDGAYDWGIEYPDQEGQTAKFSDIWRFERVLEEKWWDAEMKSDSAVYWLIESTRRTHGDSIAAYIAFMARRMSEIWRVLKRTGSVYVHCDHEANAYLRQMMDAIFGQRNFRNEIAWSYRTGGVSKRYWPRKHDTLLFYVKSDSYEHSPVQERVYYDKPFFTSDVDEEGNPYADVYVRDVWDDIKPLINTSKERTGYPTQKPQALARRMIEASSNKNDIVLDCFAGCAYVPVAAEELGRRWVACDMSPRAWIVVRRQFAKKPELSMTVEGDEGKYDDASPSFEGKGALRVFGPTQLPIRAPDDLDKGIARQGSHLAPIGFRKATLEESDDIWEAFVAEWEPYCWYCGAKKSNDRRELHLDHIEPNARDGSNDDCWNRALACAPCNSDKGNRLTPRETIEKAYEAGRIGTERRRDEMIDLFNRRHQWAKERYDGLEKQEELPERKASMA